MNKYYAVVAMLSYLSNVSASDVCKNDILEAERSGDPVKALNCLSDKIDEMTKKIDIFSTQNGKVASANSTNFDPNNPPFALRMNRSVLVCDNRFSIAYTDYIEDRKKFEFKINGSRKIAGPGDQFFARVRTSGGGLPQVTVRFLEYVKNEDAPLITYKCTDLR